MWSDKIDNKIIEAAENHHPAYNENAWQHMEKLLDKHLPQQEERWRRFIFFILFVLLIGGACFWYFLDGSKLDKKEISQSKSDTILKEIKIADEQNYRSEKESEFENIPIAKNSAINGSSINGNSFQVKAIKQDALINNSYAYSIKISINENTNKSESIAKSDDPISDDKSSLITNEKVNTAQNFIAVSSESNSSKPVRVSDKIETDLNVNSTSVQSTTDSLLDEPVVEEKEMITKKGKAESKKSSFFFVSLSAGPDMSFIGGGKTGSTEILAGAGLGYSLKNGLSFHTGFYSGRKVYTASAEAYNPPPGFSQYYPILERVDADCKVYEIPISVRYNFSRSENKNWFAGAGLSSFFMKKEKYNYTYKYTATGPSYNSVYTVNNENKYYFSVLTISAGYQQQLSKRIAVSAEPYIKIPLQGIGYGNVKLNSTGVMFTFSIKPFNAK